jgi:hypothetical protein
VLSKIATDVWSGLGVSDGTAGHFRFLGSVADAGSSDSSEVFLRIDGSIATSGADLNMTNTNIVTSATQTISTATITVPASV